MPQKLEHPIQGNTGTSIPARDWISLRGSPGAKSVICCLNGRASFVVSAKERGNHNPHETLTDSN